MTPTQPSSSQITSAIQYIETADDFDKTLLHKITQDFDTLAGMLHLACEQLELKISANQQWQLLRYLDTLLLWNKTYNLTAITEPSEALIKHIIDCLALLPLLPKLSENNNQLLDIGAGAGLPSVIIAICQPDRICQPLDSNQKKIRFIRQVASELCLSNIQPVASRIENFEGSYPLITSRAFASLVDFIALGSPYLADNGCFYAMKGKAPEANEITALSNDWSIEVVPMSVPYLSDERHLIKLRRNIQTQHLVT